MPKSLSLRGLETISAGHEVLRGVLSCPCAACKCILTTGLSPVAIEYERVPHLRAAC